jgi:hypothetical protein
MPFHSFKDLKFFVAEILKSREIFIFIGRDGRGSQNQEILSPARNITGMIPDRCNIHCIMYIIIYMYLHCIM